VVRRQQDRQQPEAEQRQGVRHHANSPVAVGELAARDRGEQDEHRHAADDEARGRAAEPEPGAHVEHDEGLERPERELPERIGHDERPQATVAPDERRDVPSHLPDRGVLVVGPVWHAPADHVGDERPDRRR
jgi:hypothetical protein